MEKTKSHRRTESSIPDKLYFRIGEVSDIVGVKPYVLRYWESEFQDIKPTKSKSGQRLYKRRDVEILVKIKGLLYDERFTINGARKRLKDMVRGDGRDESHHAAMEDDMPKQLEVFQTENTDDDLSPGERRKSSALVSRDGSTIIIKIRRDLETILESLKAE